MFQCDRWIYLLYFYIYCTLYTNYHVNFLSTIIYFFPLYFAFDFCFLENYEECNHTVILSTHCSYVDDKKIVAELFYVLGNYLNSSNGFLTTRLSRTVHIAQKPFSFKRRNRHYEENIYPYIFSNVLGFSKRKANFHQHYIMD